MQSGRLFEIIYLLMDKHQMTTAELAHELEVSSRTIRRDIESLSAAGVPVYMSRGRGGGVHLLPHYVLDKSVLSEAEQTEILSALSALRSTGVADDEAHTRLARIFQREAPDWIDIDFSFWGAPAEYKRAFEIIKKALISCRLLKFRYHDASGESSIRTVEPSRLVFKESNWYLRAFCLKRNDWRTFKLFRIKWATLEILEELFEPRPLPYALDKTPQNGKFDTLKMLFNRAAENRVREEFSPDSIEKHGDRHLLVTVETPINDRMKHYLLSYGANLEVIEPASLRLWIYEQSRAISEKYPENF